MNLPIQTHVSKVLAPTAMPYDAIISQATLLYSRPIRIWRISAFGRWPWSTIRPCSNCTNAVCVVPGSRAIMLILLLELAPPALPLAAAHIVLSHPPQDVLLSAPVGCEARADGEDGDTDGKSCAHSAPSGGAGKDIQ